MLFRIVLAALLVNLAVGCNNGANSASDHEEKGKGPSLHDLGDD